MQKRGAIVIGGLAVIVIAVVVVIQYAPNQPESVATDTSVAPGEAGMIATIDPETGETVVSAGSGDAFNTSDEGLVEVPSTAPGGGMMVDLQGRFQNTAVATVCDSDSVHIRCVPDSCKHGGQK